MACNCGCGCCGPVGAAPEQDRVQPRADLERDKKLAEARVAELERRVDELKTAS
jgi:hypothetical protein